VQAIDAWVIRHAIDLIARQARRGQRLQLEVNISGASVTDPELLAVIERELAAAEVDPACLIFEITETAAIDNIELARHFALRLGELGCGFALDDFGAGFGSFFYLKHIPFDTLKIDGEFIRGLVHCERDQIMVKAIARVALDLGTQTVAEFVADDATRELVRSYGVHYAQGYGIGRPRPITATWPGAFVEDPELDHPQVDHRQIDRSGIDRSGIDRPQIDRPQIDRSEIDRPQIGRRDARAGSAPAPA
jgi:EAL domain-containing protein (putative c-di-GMP-specific phosphodiesterase class I)